MIRLYFLIPDTQRARSLVDELRSLGIKDEKMHAIAKDTVPLEDLPEATGFERSDFPRGVEIGLAAGGAEGLLVGLLAVTMPPAGLALGGGVVLAIAGMGATMGAVLSGMVGSSYPSHHLEPFEDAIERGEILMLVDVPEDREQEIEALIKTHHPEAELSRTEPTNPVFS